MNISQKLLAMGALVLTLGITSCKDDDDKSSSAIGKQDAKAILGAFNTSTKKDLQDFSSSTGIEAIQTFFELTSADDPFGRMPTDKKGVRKFFQEKGRKFKSVFVPATSKGRTSEDDHFDFNANKGIYVWDENDEEFVRTGDSDIIRIKYPTSGSQTNNAELRLTKYSDVEVYDEEYEEYHYAVTELEASIVIGEQTAASLDLSVDYDEYGFPQAADITMGAAPYSANLSFDVSGSTTSKIAASLKNGNDILIAAEVSVKYSDTEKAEEDIKLVSGFVQLNTLKLKGEINFDEADKNEPNINDIYNFALYDGNKKLGDVVFDENDDEGLTPYIKYSDGTKEKLEDVLQPVIDELQDLTDSIEDNS